jgi:hypothetical protein
VTLGLLELLDADNLGEDKNENLKQFDSGARDVLSMRRPQLERLADELLRSPEACAAIKRAHEEAKRAVLGANHAQVVLQYANYLLSPAFDSSLPADGKPRAEAVATEFRKLMVLDADLARDTAATFAALEVARHPELVVQKLSQDEFAGAILAALTLIANASDCGSPVDGVGRPDAPTTISPGIQRVWQGAWAASFGQNVTATIREFAARQEVARGLSKSLTYRNYRFTMSNPQQFQKMVTELRSTGNERAVKFVTALHEGSAGGRGLGLLISLVALTRALSLVPPKDGKGEREWTRVNAGFVAMITVSALGMAPTATRFARQDLTRVFNWVVRREVFNGASARVAGQAIASSKVTVWFGRILGPLGDVIGVFVYGELFLQERRNEDTLGMICRGVQFGASVLGLYAFVAGVSAGLASTVVGIPLAAIAIVAGLGAILVNAIWGESELTGRIRQDLRALGITDAENEVHHRLAQYAFPIRGARGRGRVIGTRYVDLPLSSVRKNARGASVHERQMLINTYLDQYTSNAEETLIYDILRDARADGQFLKLIQGVDTSVLASEIDDSRQSADVMKWILEAYGQASQAPTPKFGPYLERVASEHWDEAIRGAIGSLDGPAQHAYHKHDAASIRRAIESLMAGITDRGEETAIVVLLQSASTTQFGVILQHGSNDFARRVRDELEHGQWQQVSQRLRSSSDPHLQALARKLDSTPRSGRTPGFPMGGYYGP